MVALRRSKQNKEYLVRYSESPRPLFFCFFAWNPKVAKHQRCIDPPPPPPSRLLARPWSPTAERLGGTLSSLPLQGLQPNVAMLVFLFPRQGTVAGGTVPQPSPPSLGHIREWLRESSRAAGVQQILRTFLASYPEEKMSSSSSPEAWLRRLSMARSDQHFCALVVNQLGLVVLRSRISIGQKRLTQGVETPTLPHCREMTPMPH